MARHYFARYNSYGIRMGGVAETFYAFAERRARDEWVQANQLGFNDQVVATECTRRYVEQDIGRDRLEMLLAKMDSGGFDAVELA